MAEHDSPMAQHLGDLALLRRVRDRIDREYAQSLNVEDLARGTPYLVPVSLAWVEERVVIAVEGSSVTARNLSPASGEARLAVGPTRDVVIIDALLEKAVDVAADDALGVAYVAQAGWDPRRSTGYLFPVLRPVRVQAWREANEILGRTLMRDSIWLV